MKKLKCKRCSGEKHEWVQRSETLPKQCPKCKSPYWDVEKRERIKLHCKKCGESWETSQTDLPKFCRHCKLPDWDKDENS